MLDTVQQAFDKFWKSVSAILIKLHFFKFYQGWIVTKSSLRNDGKIMRTKVTDQGLCIIQLIIKHSPELHFQSITMYDMSLRKLLWKNKQNSALEINKKLKRYSLYFILGKLIAWGEIHNKLTKCQCH